MAAAASTLLPAFLFFARGREEHGGRRGAWQLSTIIASTHMSGLDFCCPAHPCFQRCQSALFHIAMHCFSPTALAYDLLLAVSFAPSFLARPCALYSNYYYYTLVTHSQAHTARERERERWRDAMRKRREVLKGSLVDCEQREGGGSLIRLFGQQAGIV